MIPTQEDLKNFKEGLESLSINEIEQKIRHKTYGDKDNWHYKEATAFVEEHKAIKNRQFEQIKLEEIKEGNRLKKESNKIAWFAIIISITSLIISIWALYHGK